ncbi:MULTISPECIES: hypothetical protein [Comamonas]|uniref:hypothetical protein n=1 Tax=Comamonas TaxID=283 RepID=UPI0015F800A4
MVPLITTRWSPEAYKRQWVNTLRFFVASRSSQSTLVTCIQSESVSCGIICLALFRVENFVYFQEIFTRENYRRFFLSRCMVEEHMIVNGRCFRGMQSIIGVGFANFKYSGILIVYK